MRCRITPRSSLVMVALAIALVATFTGQVALARQDGSEWAAWTGVPGPEECTAEPIDLATFVDELVAAAASPTPGDVPLQIGSIDELPAGEPASAEETYGALSTVRALLACVNAGKFDSLLALFTPDGLVQLLFGTSGLDASAMTEDDIRAAIEFFAPILSAPATPVAEGERAELTEIRDVRKLPDGRILVVSVGDATVTEGEAYAVLEEVDGRWLIDVAGEIGGMEAPTPAS